MAFDIKLVNGRLPGFKSIWDTLESPLFSPNKLCDCMGCGPCEPERTATAFYLEALCSQTGLSIHNSDPIRVISPTGEKPMFTNFEKDSQKVIKVSGYLFELIADHQVRATHITTEQAQDLRFNRSFLVVSGDAAISCEVIALSHSCIDEQIYFVEFKLTKECQSN